MAKILVNNMKKLVRGALKLFFAPISVFLHNNNDSRVFLSAVVFALSGF